MKQINQPTLYLLGLGGLLFIALAVLFAPFGVFAQDDGDFTYAGQTPAPEFPVGLTWFNVPEPLQLAELQGKIVLLDFWTYGCINCIHVIPDLKRLEAEFPDELVVIGVHSAKFDNEGLSANIRQIVQRYEVVHPVVNDADFQVWSSYGVRAWPSLYLIDPLGLVVGRHEGEGVYNALQSVITTMAQEYSAAGLIDPEPITLTPELDNLGATPLRFPGAVLVDAENQRLFIADTGQHRIVIADLGNYEVLQIIGTGEAGLTDGEFNQAQFNSPHGMRLLDDILYVADTDNHSLRAIDFSSETVTTVAGTGEKAEFLMREGSALSTALRSPWDISEHDGILYFAMAGSHQLWSFDPANRTVAPFAGNSREDLIDGPRLDALLAQPSGIETDGQWVYFTDSESSSIRRAELGEGGYVETLIGPVNLPQGRLFAFGDVDGIFDEVRLQHPLGITIAEDGLVYFTDTYNNKIKVLNPQTQSSQTFAGEGSGGYFDGNGAEAMFYEPGGLDYYNGKLYVADTNNHAVRVVDIETQNVVSIIFPNVNLLLGDEATVSAPLDAPLSAPTTSDEVLGDIFGLTELILPLQEVQPGAGTIMIDAVMPFGYKLNAQAPFTALWPEDAVVMLAEDQRQYRVITPDLPISFEAEFSAGQTNLNLDLTIYWCEAINETLCFVERGRVVIPILVSEAALGRVVSVSYQLTPPSFESDFD